MYLITLKPSKGDQTHILFVSPKPLKENLQVHLHMRNCLVTLKRFVEYRDLVITQLN